MINFLHEKTASIMRARSDDFKRLLREFAAGALEDKPLQLVVGDGQVEADPTARLCNSSVLGTVKAGPGSIMIDCVVQRGSELELGEGCVAVGLKLQQGKVKMSGGSCWVGGACWRVGSSCELSDGAVFHAVDVPEEGTCVIARGAHVGSTTFGDIRRVELGPGCLVLAARFTGSGVSFADDCLIMPKNMDVRSAVPTTLDEISTMLRAGVAYGVSHGVVPIVVLGRASPNDGLLLSVGPGSVLRAGLHVDLARRSHIGANFRLFESDEESGRLSSRYGLVMSTGELYIGPGVTWISGVSAANVTLDSASAAGDAFGSLRVSEGTTVVQELSGFNLLRSRVSSVPGHKLVI